MLLFRLYKTMTKYSKFIKNYFLVFVFLSLATHKLKLAVIKFKECPHCTLYCLRF